jgi:hypothetical protein
MELQEPLVNTLLLWLQALCFFLAKQPHSFFAAESLFNSVGRFDAPLSAFVGGDRACPSIRGLAEKPKLSGWRCLHCGYAQVSHRNIEAFIADDILPAMIFHACETLTLDQLVDRVLAGELADIAERREQMAEALRRSNISLSGCRATALCGPEPISPNGSRRQRRGVAWLPSECAHTGSCSLSVWRHQNAVHRPRAGVGQ